MKKVTGFMGAAILAGGVLAGCSADSENTAPEEDTVEETTVPAETEETDQTAEDAAGDVSESTENAAEEVDEATQDAQDSLGEAADAVEEEAADIGEAVEEGTNDAQESVENAIEEPTEESVEGTEATGTFNGLADPHTVEIEVDGVPNAYQVEAGSETMAKFEAMETGDSVTFVYVKNGEQFVINEVK